MGIFYMKFEVKDASGDTCIFKYYPNQQGKIVVEEDTLDSSLDTREELNKFIVSAHSYMSKNTINKVKIKEGED